MNNCTNNNPSVPFLYSESPPPLQDVSGLSPFWAVVVIQEPVTEKWQAEVSAWLVQAGCLYMIAWGRECSSWDDSVDVANIEQFDYEEVPEAKFVMTTWHENEPLKEVFWFSKNNAFHPVVEINNTLILDISNTSHEQELLAEYNHA